MKKMRHSYVDWEKITKNKEEYKAILDEVDCNEAVQASVKRIKEFAYHELNMLKRRCPKSNWPQERFNLIFNEVWLHDQNLF